MVEPKPEDADPRVFLSRALRLLNHTCIFGCLYFDVFFCDWSFLYFLLDIFVFCVLVSAENTCTLASLNFVLRIKLSLRVRWVLVVTWIILRNNLNVLKAEIYMAKVKEIIATELGSIAKVEIWWQLTSVQALLVCKHPGTGSFGSTAQVPWKIWLYHLSCEAFLWGKNMILHLVWC